VKYRGAIVGLGNVAVAGHLPAWQQNPDFTLCAVVDPVEERLALARHLLPGIAYYRRIEELFARERLDCIDICAPPLLHDVLLLAACQYNVHILCEKSLTLSPATWQGLHSYTEEQPRVVCTVHNWQYAPLFQTLKKLLAANTVGPPGYLELITLRTAPAGRVLTGENSWRLDPQVAGGGILIDHGWHVFYLVPWLLACKPRTIAVQLKRRRLPADAVEDTATGTIAGVDARARFHLTWAGERRSNERLLRGSKGTLRFDAASVVIEKSGEEPRKQHFTEPLTASSYHPEWFAAVLEEFQREIEDPSARGQNLQAAALCLALTERAYESHRCGGIALPLNNLD